MFTSIAQDPGVVITWWEDLMKNSAKTKNDDPNYYSHEPETLRTKSNLGSFIVGTGDDIYAHLQQSIESAQSEIILITCFWANSPSLTKLVTSLRSLSQKVVRSGRPKVRVFLGFSSVSIFQKLFQTSSLHGHQYSPAEWQQKLGLPLPNDLPGLDIEIKSIFVRPFSVMHPKFIIIDRKTAWLPSCNVSWENWFEGCVSLSGPVVLQFVSFWKHFWLRGAKYPADNELATSEREEPLRQTPDGPKMSLGASHSVTEFNDRLSSVYTIFLPSPHHVNPNLRPWPWIQAHPPPPTPLNLFILSLFSSASSTIFIQTPNLTAPPVLSAILAALRRGVQVHIVTSERLMILEQLVTAGTTTARCIKKLIKRYRQSFLIPRLQDEEIAMQPLIGKLTVEYFTPKVDPGPGEPLQSHLKLTIVDGEWTILGSGNMDRASWYTSQELGLAFLSRTLAREVRATIDQQLIGRKRTVFDTASNA
jgi:phosphatidylserine/phosphatidylglycerophosphate/cardiolipin synthase-like enzyme